jgi:hypothetical protein
MGAGSSDLGAADFFVADLGVADLGMMLVRERERLPTGAPSKPILTDGKKEMPSTDEYPSPRRFHM